MITTVSVIGSPTTTSVAERLGLASSNFPGHFFRADNGHYQVSTAHGRGIDKTAIGHGFLDAIEELRLFEHNVGSARGRAGIGIGPAIARSDKPQFGQAEIEHGSRRLADVLAELRANEDDNRRRRGHINLSSRFGPSGGAGSSLTASAISAKSPGSVNSL